MYEYVLFLFFNVARLIILLIYLCHKKLFNIIRVMQHNLKIRGFRYKMYKILTMWPCLASRSQETA